MSFTGEHCTWHMMSGLNNRNTKYVETNKLRNDEAYNECCWEKEPTTPIEEQELMVFIIIIIIIITIVMEQTYMQQILLIRA